MLGDKRIKALLAEFDFNERDIEYGDVFVLVEYALKEERELIADWLENKAAFQYDEEDILTIKSAAKELRNQP